jgi:hypothetical protein
MTTQSILPAVLLSCSLVAGVACNDKAADPQVAPDTNVASTVAQFDCSRPSSIGRTNRTELCRVLHDFDSAGAFTQLPAKDDQIWLGLAYTAAPGSELEEAAERSFVVLYLHPGAPPADVATQRAFLPESSLVAMTVEDATVTRFGHPTGPNAASESADFEHYNAAVDGARQHSLGPEAIAELAKLRGVTDPVRAARGPVAAWHTTGASLLMRGQLPGAHSMFQYYLRTAGDGRALLVNGPEAAELWRVK